MQIGDGPLILLVAAVQIKIEGGGMVPVGGGPAGRMHLSATQQAQHAQQHAAQQAAQQQVGAGGMMGGYTGMLLPASNGYGEAAPQISDRVGCCSAVKTAMHVASVCAMVNVALFACVLTGRARRLFASLLQALARCPSAAKP